MLYSCDAMFVSTRMTFWNLVFHIGKFLVERIALDAS